MNELLFISFEMF